MFMFGGPDYDIIIVGSGPAGMTAAIYARRSGKSVLVIEKEKFGGQVTSSPKVENFPGKLEMAGSDFANDLLKQAMENGAEFMMGNVVRVDDETEYKTVTTEEGETYSAKAVILANGVKHRTLGLSGEGELIGHSVHFCVVCDGNLYQGKTAAIIGGGNTALQEAVMLADLAKEVVIVQNLEFLTGEQRLIDILEEKAECADHIFLGGGRLSDRGRSPQGPAYKERGRRDALRTNLRRMLPGSRIGSKQRGLCRGGGAG